MEEKFLEVIVLLNHRIDVLGEKVDLLKKAIGVQNEVIDLLKTGFIENSNRIKELEAKD